jgi:hypothetical protein
MIPHIRSYTPDDYPALVALNNLIWVDEPATIDEMQADAGGE